MVISIILLSIIDVVVRQINRTVTKRRSEFKSIRYYHLVIG